MKRLSPRRSQARKARNMSNTLRSLNHLLVLLTCAASIWAWMSLPELESYPIHWNAAGEADGFSSKRGVLLVLSLLPITAISTHLLMWFLPKIESIKEAIEKSGIVYDVTWHGCLWLYLVMNGVIALMYMSLLKGDASSFDSDLMMRVMPVALGLLFIVLGNVLGKVRLNKYVGIKTPWTLKSKSTWDATHRMSARLWVGGGLAMLAIPFALSGAPAVYVLVGLVTLLSFVPIVYAYVFYKSAADRPD